MAPFEPRDRVTSSRLSDCNVMKALYLHGAPLGDAQNDTHGTDGDGSWQIITFSGQFKMLVLNPEIGSRYDGALGSALVLGGSLR